MKRQRQPRALRRLRRSIARAMWELTVGDLFDLARHVEGVLVERRKGVSRARCEIARRAREASAP